MSVHLESPPTSCVTGVFSLDHAGYLDKQHIQFRILSLVSFYSKEPIRCSFSLLQNRV